MASRQLDEEAIFHTARKIDNAEARREYLDQICAGDQPLRERVEALLKFHEQEHAFLNSDSPNPPPTAEVASPTERAGATIGRYRLMEQIGEGGMGVVFVAEQEKPIRRKVALKVIKPGMDSKTVIARFESERQALAMMDHTNIAKVLDAGTTDAGRPYFVMELVHGIPITDYCDRNKLTIRDRLALFMQVCQAIQHAHQKGIIHRDIKPTNVLVTLHDGKPVPKVIDFGVAKALHQRPTDRTVYTSFAQVVGTPLYMSPEQAELSGLDIDTRSDVYSLGALLYELLTGTTPFDKQQFAKAAYDEIRRIIRETDPPKPSTKIGSLGDTATSVSVQRGTDQRTLSRLLTGDLDIIAMKALEKDRTRRYDTASGLAADVQRFLSDEPIVARPPSLVYRSGKFARRNRAAVVTSALVLASLLAGIIATSCMARSLKKEVEQKNRTLQQLADSSYGKAVAAALSGDSEEAEAALKNAQSPGSSSYRINVLNGLVALNKGDLEDAIRLAEQALQDEPPTEDVRRIGASALLAYACISAGYDDRYYPVMHNLRDLEPQTESDRLLLAQAQLMLDPREAMNLVATVPRIKYSPAGLLIRANATKHDSESREKSLRDYEYAQFLFRDSQLVVSLRIWALANAVIQSRLENRPEEALRYTQEGRPLADRLEAATGNPFGDWTRSYFYAACGEDEKAFHALLPVGRNSGTYSWFLGAECLRRSDYATALREFEKAMYPRHEESKYVRISKAHLVRDLPDGPQKVQNLMDGLLDDRSPVIHASALAVMCLASTPSEIHNAALRVINTIPPESREVFDPFDCSGQVEFLAGRLTEAELLERSSKYNGSLPIAHYTIAMLGLASKDRNQAKTHFGLCVATGSPDNMACAWARAYQVHMGADPTWPHWLHDNDGK